MGEESGGIWFETWLFGAPNMGMEAKAATAPSRRAHVNGNRGLSGLKDHCQVHMGATAVMHVGYDADPFMR